ncbi:hypothetical protein CC1G_03619 [Coprinopsis cinerea okayama7|uniref:Uncharacterized protein n=1 Tax=Coprinopsis cinerea (strain Okayama-7 / 130 / ATCC MYA-4618 / FGSC 9003) TaxID=240176 RepID=A8NCR1_COPC7|nr:hypothetical protein CC1G_03619 [Coprinopsis cinerea okayama7\|eukprot:XP_001832605.2 hypothetical protein CC1G_03619 [Coprinopsis cinerea okayama7\
MVDGVLRNVRGWLDESELPTPELRETCATTHRRCHDMVLPRTLPSFKKSFGSEGAHMSANLYATTIGRPRRTQHRHAFQELLKWGSDLNEDHAK